MSDRICSDCGRVIGPLDWPRATPPAPTATWTRDDESDDERHVLNAPGDHGTVIVYGSREHADICMAALATPPAPTANDDLRERMILDERKRLGYDATPAPTEDATLGFPGHEADCHCHAAVARYLARVSAPTEDATLDVETRSLALAALQEAIRTAAMLRTERVTIQAPLARDIADYLARVSAPITESRTLSGEAGNRPPPPPPPDKG